MVEDAPFYFGDFYMSFKHLACIARILFMVIYLTINNVGNLAPFKFSAKSLKSENG